MEFLLLGQQLHSKHDAPPQRHGTWNEHTWPFEPFQWTFSQNRCCRTKDYANKVLEALTENYSWEEVFDSMGSALSIISAIVSQQTLFSVCRMDSGMESSSLKHYCIK